MNIGYCNIYSFRPHVEHLLFIEKMLRALGNNSFFLVCDGVLLYCYPRELKGAKKICECPKCIIGGIRGFPVAQITSIVNSSVYLDSISLNKMALSSSCTLHRTEADKEWYDKPVVETRKRLLGAINLVYQCTLRWIEQNRLDAVICFNGRMDVTCAITGACEFLGVPYAVDRKSVV